MIKTKSNLPFEILTLLSPAPAALTDIAKDLEISVQCVRDRISYLRGAGYDIVVAGGKASIPTENWGQVECAATAYYERNHG